MERGSRRITMTVLCAGMAQAQAGGLPATQLPTVLVVEDELVRVFVCEV